MEKCFEILYKIIKSEQGNSLFKCEVYDLEKAALKLFGRKIILIFKNCLIKLGLITRKTVEEQIFLEYYLQNCVKR